MEIICYSCGRGEMPENTLEEIQQCQDINLTWRIEMDVQLTKDEELVLFQDEKDTLRLTGTNKKISELNSKELQSLNPEHYFKSGDFYPLREKPLSIPFLNDVFLKFPKKKN